MYTTKCHVGSKALLYYPGSPDHGKEIVTHGGISYSWRSGKALKEINPTSVSFSKGKPLVNALQDRKKYLEDLAQFVSNPQGTPSGGPRYYTHDTGHSFHGVRFGSVGRAETKWYRYRYPDETLNQHLVGPVTPRTFLIPQFGILPKDSNFAYSANGLTSPNRNWFDNESTKFFWGIDPFKHQIGLGETLVELVQGNIPKIVSKLINVFKDNTFLNAIKKAPKGASQDYLNSQFGIGPILDDLYTVLVTGISIHDSIYNRSDRRKRKGPLYAYSSTTDVSSFSTGGLTLGPNNTFSYLGVSGGTIFDSPRKATSFMNYDLRFTSRLSVGRASNAQNGRYDKAVELARQYGLWTPSLIWEIAPWSWMVDWFINISRGINLANDYGTSGLLTPDYAYVTAKFKSGTSWSGGRTEKRYKSSWYEGFSNGCTQYCNSTVRLPVSPFNTRVDVSQLSSWQMSILVALGLTRAR